MHSKNCCVSMVWTRWFSRRPAQHFSPQWLLELLITIAIAWCCSLLTLWAQSRSTEVRIWTFADAKGIRLGWTLPTNMPLPAEWHILRRRSGQRQYHRIGNQRRLPPAQWQKLLPYPRFADTLRLWIELAQDPATADTLRNQIVSLLQESLLADFSRLSTLFGTSWYDSTLQRGVRYDYAIEANGNILAEVHNVQWSGEQLPAPPTELEAEPADSNAVYLRWNIRDDQSRGILGYFVERRSEASSRWERRTAHPVITFFIDPSLPIRYLYVDTGLVIGQRYWYRVRAVDLLGRVGAASKAASVTPMDVRPLIPPFALIASVVGGSVRIRWKPSPDPRVVGYHLYRWEYGKEETKRRLNTTLLHDTIFIDHPQTGADYITYAVSAVDRYGRESELSLPHTVPQPDTIPPHPPKKLKVKTEVGKVLLQWEPSASPDAYAYEVARTIDPKRGEYTLVSDSLLFDTRFTDPLPVEAGRTTFWYRVRTVDRHGNRSSWSVPIAAHLPDVVPPQPPWIIGVRAKPDALILRWQPPYDPDLFGYIVYRYQDTTVPPLQLTPKPLPKTVTAFVDSTVFPGQTYWYTVVAVDSAGNRSPFALRVQGRTYSHAIPPPPEVDSVVATPGAVAIFFSYKHQQPRVQCFVIERSTDGRKFVPISPMLSPQTHRFIDRAIMCQQICYYRVRARSVSGIWSPPSRVRKVLLP